MLQANATIIAGVLILLTLLASVGDPLKLITKLMIIVAIAPFIASIFYLLFKKFNKKVIDDDKRWSKAKLSTALGLCYLFVVVVYFVIGIE